MGRRHRLAVLTQLLLRTKAACQHMAARIGAVVAPDLARISAASDGRRTPSDRTRVAILAPGVHGMGGITRTVINLADYLSKHYDVELVAVTRRRRRSFFLHPVDVQVILLNDRFAKLGLRWRLVRGLLGRCPSLLVHEHDDRYAEFSLWTDLLVLNYLKGATGVLITTRPSLNIVAARHAPFGVRTIGQEHMSLGTRRAAMRADIQRYYPRLDALAVLTETDRRDYVGLFRSGAPPVVLLPNAVPAIEGGRADPTRKTVVAAGRLTRAKGFDRLIPAWSQVARSHPDWRLEIYGSGPERDALQLLVDQHGLSGTVQLKGRTNRLGHAFANSSIFVLSSRREGFPMVILEAMSRGLPVVSFDCPTGPAEIVVDDHNGVLVPNGDIPALTEALRQLIEDDEQRARLGNGALETATRYDVESIGKQWTELIDGLLSTPSTLPGALPRLDGGTAG